MTLAASPSSAETVKLTVDGMVCAFCAGSIEKKLRANKETADVFVSLENKIVAVAQKPGMKLDDQVLRKQIADAGYEVKAIERTPESIAQIRASVRGK
ncbi:MAG: heavy-metal-associated domain-containing protein [Casimicrobiaceae bacterium]|nr:heavy-metal-associated domain-containing protein [Casimicrobiaceae bacterium]